MLHKIFGEVYNFKKVKKTLKYGMCQGHAALVDSQNQ